MPTRGGMQSGRLHHKSLYKTITQQSTTECGERTGWHDDSVVTDETQQLPETQQSTTIEKWMTQRRRHYGKSH